ncbi:MAG: TRC40/GET3/ArsA family transport-energizing ATPase [Gudongella sp.]|nr:TRC40/GET3/ArsA family transport-energizing ATPase [Gudongella sp.]
MFFGGKGGVGKTTGSASYALHSAQSGLKTLLVSTDPAHSTSDIFDKQIGETIGELYPNLDAIEISGAKESAIYMNGVRESLKNIVSPIIVAEINKQIDAASISPGTEEAALFDKMIEIIVLENDNYDRIIFDTAPTGHTVRLLSLPELLGGWLESLIEKREKSITIMSMAMNQAKKTKENIESDEVIKILRKRYERVSQAKEIMTNKDLVSFMFVINAEKLPIDETKKAISILEKYNITIEGVIVNKLLPDDLKDDFWIKKKQDENMYLDIIKDTFKDKRIYKLPMLKDDINSENLAQIADKFNIFENSAQ